MKMRKRILSIFMAFAMLMSLMPAFTLTANAADIDEFEVRYSIDNGTTWENDTFYKVISKKEVISAENVQIELLRDIVFTGTVPEGSQDPHDYNWEEWAQYIGGTNATWTIDGKGYKITRGRGANALFDIPYENSDVTFRNITIDGGAVWDDAEDLNRRTNSGVHLSGDSTFAHQLLSVSNNSTLTLDEGTVLQNCDTEKSGSAVVVGTSSKKGTLIIKAGAEIKNNCSKAGSGVYVNSGSVANMEGGKIYNNTSSSNGGAVLNLGQFNMKSGEIYNNKGSNGGAVNNQSQFSMTGGEIYNNKASYGSGIMAQSGTAKISGGKIYSNQCEKNVWCGGILVYGNNALEISGNPEIRNNTDSNGAACNIYLLKGTTITVFGELSCDQIGLTTQSVPTEDTPVNITGTNNADYSKYFKSDNENYVIKNTANVVQLAKLHIHTIVHHDAVPATCTEAGNREYWTCSVCSKIFSDENGTTEIDEIPIVSATEHNWGDWTITKAPTESETGTAERVCTKNNEHKDTVTLPVLTNTGVWTAGAKVEPTEDADGSQEYTSEYGTVTVILKYIPEQTELKPGESVTIGDTTVTNGEDGTVTITDGDDKEIIITLKENEDITVGEDGTVTIPDGSTVKTGDNGEIKLPQGGIVDTDTNVSGESVIIDDTTITAPKGETVTVDKDGNTSVPKSSTIEKDDTIITITEGDKAVVDKDDNIIFPDGGKITVDKDGKTVTVDVPVNGKIDMNNLPTLTPTAKPNHSSGSSSYKVTFNAGKNGKITKGNASVSVSYNSKIKEASIPTVTANEGYKFIGWSKDGKTVIDPTMAAVKKPITFTALYEAETTEPIAEPIPTPEAKRHEAYIVGYNDGTFRPDGNITRAETTAILARLTDGFDENGSYEPVFPDVANDLWYSKYIGFEASKNIISGYPDGTFNPEASITRAEFAVVITKFANITAANADMPFTDTDGHWASEQISACYVAGYIAGYEDNTFRPDSYITRAEAVVIINRVLDRNDIKDFKNTFTDVNGNHWSYTDIMEAAVTHEPADLY